MIIHRAAQGYQGLLLYIPQDIAQICLYLLNGIDIAGMEGHGDHRLHSAQVHINHAVVVCHRAGLQFLVGAGSAMNLIKLFDDIIGLPDRGQAGGLGSHDVDADTEIRA